MPYEADISTSRNRETVLHREIDIELNVDVRRMLDYYRTRDYKKYTEIQSQYQKLKNDFELSKKGARGLTKEEFKKLQNDIDSFENIIEKNEKESHKLEKKLSKNNVDDLVNNRELYYLLSYTNEHYNEKQKGGIISGFLAKVGYEGEESLRNIKDKTELNEFQEKIIHKLGVGDKGYSKDGRLASFHKLKGNFITNVRNVEVAIGRVGVQNVETKAIASYLNYLEGTGRLNSKYLHTLGKDNVRDLANFYIKHIKDDEFDSVSSKIGSSLEYISKTYDDVVEVVSSAANTVVESASEGINNISKNINSLGKKVINSFSKEKSEKYYEIKEENELKWRNLNLLRARKRLKIVLEEIQHLDKNSKEYKSLLKEKRKLENIITKALSIIKEHNASIKLNEALGKVDNNHIFKIDDESEKIAKKTLSENKEESTSKSKIKKAKNNDNIENETTKTKEPHRKNKNHKEIEGVSLSLERDESGKITAYDGIVGDKKVRISISELKGEEIEELKELELTNYKEYKKRIRKLIAFKSFLEETGLGFVWKYRDRLKQKLSQTDTFYDYKDGLSEKEQLELLNFISSKIGLNKKESLVDFKKDFEDIKNKKLFRDNDYSKFDDNEVFLQIFKDKGLIELGTNTVKESVWL